MQANAIAIQKLKHRSNGWMESVESTDNNCPAIEKVDLGISVHINTLRPKQDGRHFPDDILKCIFLNKNVWISLTISLKCVRKVRINNFP